jgi:hypothetical protein
LGFSVRTTANYWELITTVKHPVMRDKLDDVQKTLTTPDEIRISKSDPQAYLFYREVGAKRWFVLSPSDWIHLGFLIPAYKTSAIKGGEIVWHK